MAAKEKKALGTGLDVLFGSDDWDDQNAPEGAAPRDL